MQKKIIALAIAAAFAAPVAAMADATVYGALDGGLRSVTTNGNTLNTMGSGTYNSNRFGIKSVEDLGDGLKANVVLEGGIVTNDGSQPANTTLFDRTTTVGLSGAFGAVDLGRMYSVAYKVNNDIDPFAHKFIGITSANLASGYTLSATGAKAITRNSSDVGYTGKFGDVTVLAERSFGSNTTAATQNANGSDAGATTAVGASYTGGPIIVGASYSKVKSNATNTAPDSDMTHWQLGAGFNFGAGSVKAGYAEQKNADTDAAGAVALGSEVKAKNMWIGANFNVSDKVGVTAAYYKTTTTASTPAASADVNGTNVVAAVTYALSKRTLMYAEIDKQTSDKVVNVVTGATASDTNGYSLGLSTSF